MANLNLTATTTYPCFGQDLGDSEGAGSSDLPMQTYKSLLKNAFFEIKKSLIVAFHSNYQRFFRFLQ
jgi:hypothetical protein